MPTKPTRLRGGGTSARQVLRAEHYRKGNVAAAQIILCDVARYGGEEAGLVRWARLVVGSEVRD